MNYSGLYEYINYFEDTSREFCNWTTGEINGNKIALGYPVYSEELENFISKVYETDLLKHDYLTYLESLVEIIETEEINDYIDKADFETVKAILTYYVRQYRFNESIWERAARKGMFYKILTRIKEIAD